MSFLTNGAIGLRDAKWPKCPCGKTIVPVRFPPYYTISQAWQLWNIPNITHKAPCNKTYEFSGFYLRKLNERLEVTAPNGQISEALPDSAYVSTTQIEKQWDNAERKLEAAKDEIRREKRKRRDSFSNLKSEIRKLQAQNKDLKQSCHQFKAENELIKKQKADLIETYNNSVAGSIDKTLTHAVELVESLTKNLEAVEHNTQLWERELEALLPLDPNCTACYDAEVVIKHILGLRREGSNG